MPLTVRVPPVWTCRSVHFREVWLWDRYAEKDGVSGDISISGIITGVMNAVLVACSAEKGVTG